MPLVYFMIPLCVFDSCTHFFPEFHTVNLNTSSECICSGCPIIVSVQETLDETCNYNIFTKTWEDMKDLCEALWLPLLFQHLIFIGNPLRVWTCAWQDRLARLPGPHTSYVWTCMRLNPPGCWQWRQKWVQDWMSSSFPRLNQNLSRTKHRYCC